MPVNEGGAFEQPPSGTHMAICYRVIDLGTQTTVWEGDTKHQRKVLLTWELPDELMEDNRPFMVSNRYTLSSHEKAKLRQDLEGWRGKRFTEADFGPGGFDIKNIIGKPCLLSLVQKDKDGRTYTNIASVSAPPKGMTVPAQTNVSVYFSLDTFDQAVFDALSDNLKGVIMTSPEYQSLNRPNETRVIGYPQESAAEADENLDDDIPF
jgi:hypothetical protein